MFNRRVPRPAGRRRHPAALELEPRTLLSIAVDIRYDYDINGLFAAPERRAVLQAAVNTVASTLGDSLAAIAPTATNTWSASFTDPGTGLTRTIANLVVPADTLILYVGGRDLSGTTVGSGGYGGYSSRGTQEWLDTVHARGQTGALAGVPTDFGPWGGSISFDTVGTNFSFGLDPAGIGFNQTDFYSVAMHEFGHVLGMISSSSWGRYISGGVFTGPNAVAAYGGLPVPLAAGGSHWAAGTLSDGAPAAMTP
ncbi:MAG TPA: hypothetical protein VF590_10115, partial [Isosphaeraceae bacterium]